MTKHKRAAAGTLDSPAREGGRPERVRKRDGRCVPFERAKIAAAIHGAMEAVGELDEPFAEELASVVELSLLERIRKRAVRAGRARRPARGTAPDRHRAPEGDVPTIEEIQDLVERALMELGRPNVAKAYILYRDRRTRVREAVRVHRSDSLHARIRVREDEGVSAWSKGRIVAALMAEAELSREAAEEVASAVEHRVFDSQARCITTALVRELVAAELFERGWIRALSATRTVGVARCDLETLLRGESLEPWREPAPLGRTRETSVPGGSTHRTARPSARDVGDNVAGELLRRFVLEDVLSEGKAELHRAGDLHVVGLDHPELPLSLCVPAGLLAGAERSVQGAFELLGTVGELAREVAHAVVLERPARVLEPLVAGDGAGSLDAWLSALTAISRASGTRLALGSCADGPTSLVARLVESLGERAGDPFAPWLYLGGRELEELLGFRPDLSGATERLLARGLLHVVWGRDGEAYVGPGCRRFGDEPGVVSCAGAVALNLPRLARRAGPFREGLVFSGLAELVAASVELAGTLVRFQTELARPPAGLHTRRSFALVPVGLREALAVLGDGSADPEVGARLLGLFAEAAGRFTARESAELPGLPGLVGIAPCSVFAREAAQRFAWLDARRRHTAGHQGWLFEDEEYHRERPKPYTEGLRLGPYLEGPHMEGRGPVSGRAEAEVSRTLAAGSLSFVSLPAFDSAEPEPCIGAWRRFEERRRELLGHGDGDFELFPTAPTARRASEIDAPSPQA